MGRWVTINGKPVFIKSKGVGLSVAVVVALGAAGAGGGLDLAAGLADSASAVRGSDAAHSSSKSRSRARPADVARRLQKLAKLAKATDADEGTDCAAHAYGEVQTWLRAHPCVGYARALAQVQVAGGATVLVAVAAVQMPDRAEAAALRALLDREGSGNITELSRERGPFTGVRFDGAVYRSRLDDDIVVDAQAQLAVRGRSAPDLLALARAALG